jgi:putative membrane protein
MWTIATVLVAAVALVHVTFAVVEILFWKHPLVHTRLGYSDAEARKVAPIVANAGLYNGFVAAGLIWGLLPHGDVAPIAIFFLACVIVAGVFGTATLKTLVPLVLQSGLGVAALVVVLVA